ncbi:hypothetical protein V0288_10405 [Pannus brasiliensis CCIBt3594]|uniref:Uncharacterized protein n=1 Tax=Pannus brasiliensis CCIBt3594 TaxID=1427578 RepID=A0AAW9QQN2_9CHRO
MEIFIESTKQFESDLEKFSEQARNLVMQKTNCFVSLFPSEKDSEGYRRKLHQPPRAIALNDSSVYTLIVSPKLRVIWSIEEDIDLDRTVFTLLRVVDRDGLDRAYESLAESLSRDLDRRIPETIKIEIRDKIPCKSENRNR